MSNRIENHLTPGETLLAVNNPPHTRASYYATEKRVIRYEKGMFSEKLSDLAYKSITSVNLTSNLRAPWLIIVGIGLFIIGILVGQNIGTLMIFGGILVAILGFYLKESYYQFIATGIDIDSPEGKKWQIYGTDTDEAQQFVRTVREHLT